MRSIIPSPKANYGSVTSLMGKAGLDFQTLPQLMDISKCLDNTNYWIKSDPGLEKREGHTELVSAAGTEGIRMIKKYTKDLIVFGYKNTVAAYSISSDTVQNLKTNYVLSGDFDAVRWGDYMFVVSGEDLTHRLSQTLAYDTQTANFTAGLMVTGATSGATGIILEDTDSGASGTLTLGSVEGTFLNDEIIADTSTGSATANGTVTLAYTAISDSPKASVINAIGSRLYTGKNGGQVWYSGSDSGTNPPFTTWTPGTNSADPGKINFRNAGNINAIEPLGNLVVVFADDGKWAFSLKDIDSGGTIKKIEDVQMYRIDQGGARGAISTKAGLFYANEQGIWQLVAVGQDNVKYSDQESVVSVQLGSEYFDDIDLSQCDMAYIPKRNTLLLACGKDSMRNNQYITYNTEMKAFGRFTGLNTNRFLQDGDVVYGGDSQSNSIHVLFDGNDDNGNEIWASYVQELRTGSLEQNQAMVGQYAHGFLSPSSEIDMSFDIYTYEGEKVADKAGLLWTTDGGTSDSDGYSSASWGLSSIGGDTEVSGLVESFAGARARINNYQRLIVKFSEHSRLPHSISWFSVQTRGKRPIRRRNMAAK